MRSLLTALVVLSPGMVHAACAVCVGGDPERAAMLTLLDSRWRSHSIAAEFEAERIAPIAMELARDHPAFARGTPGRVALVETLLQARSRDGGWIWSERSPQGDFVISELLEGTSDIRLAILNTRPALQGPYQAEVCDFLARYVSGAGSIDDVTVLLQSLRALAGCGVRPALVVPLRGLVLDGADKIDPRILEDDRRMARNATSIRSAAAHALLSITPDVPGEVEWLRTLNDGESALAAREGFGYGLAPGGRFDHLDDATRRAWMEALLELTRGTLDRRMVWGDEVALFASLGERYPEFREDVGELFQELLARGVRDGASVSAIRATLERWSTAP